MNKKVLKPPPRFDRITSVLIMGSMCWQATAASWGSRNRPDRSRGSLIFITSTRKFLYAPSKGIPTEIDANDAPFCKPRVSICAVLNKVSIQQLS